jgi:hypothetical protein
MRTGDYDKMMVKQFILLSKFLRTQMLCTCVLDKHALRLMGCVKYRYLFSSFLIGLIFYCAFPLPTLAETLSLSQPLTVRWEYQTEQTVNFTPAISEDVVYLPLTSGNLLSLRISDGKLLWKEETGGEFSASPLADERGVYVASVTGVNASLHFPSAT